MVLFILENKATIISFVGRNFIKQNIHFKSALYIGIEQIFSIYYINLVDYTIDKGAAKNCA